MLEWVMRHLCAWLPGRGKTEAAPETTSPGDRDTATAATAAPSRQTATTAATAEAEAPDDALAPLLEINGIGPKTVQHLHEGGYTTMEAVRAAGEEELAAVQGVGRRAAATLKRALADGAA